MPAEKAVDISLDDEVVISRMIPLVQELITELEAWDKTYGILPQLNNILRKLDKGDLEGANVKLEALLEHLNELLTDPDGPFYGNEEAEALLEDVIEKVEDIYREGTVCGYIEEWYSDVQIIYPDTYIIIRVRCISPETFGDEEPEVWYEDFRLDCLDELYDIPECVYALLSESDLEIINGALAPCE
jgi:hypothetical protein